METTVTGDSYVLELSRFVRSNEQSLSGKGVAQRSSSGKVTLVPPKPLSLSLHHLSYILLRFDALGLPTGSLEDVISLPSRPKSTFSYISTGEQRRSWKPIANAETASLTSFRSAISRISISAVSTTSPWFSRSTPPSPDQEVKYLYSAFTKLPALDVIASPMVGLIEGFEDIAVPNTLTPFDVFKNLQLLTFTDVDPRTVSGWDRLACQLRSLTLIRTGLEDVEELIVNQVIRDARKRAQVQRRQSGVGGDTSDASTSSAGLEGNSDRAVASDAHTNAAELPSLAWHFLTNLGLPSSSLTFFTILSLPSLRSLDLSHNLLNAVPPALSNLASLQSIDLSDNLIEDARGVREALPSVRILNLRGNRLESLSGLDSLVSLRQIDLRDNAVYEPSEIGRLSQLSRLSAIWVKGNPLWEEYPDPRVELLLEFAKEGWPLNGATTITMDGEAAGYFEKRRVVERLPLGVKLAPTGSTRRQPGSSSGERRLSMTPRAAESEMTAKQSNIADGDLKGNGDDAVAAGAKVIAVKHHWRGRSNKVAAASSPKKRGATRRSVDADVGEVGELTEASQTRANHSATNQQASKVGSEARRNQRHRKRIVDFDGDGDSKPRQARSGKGRASAADHADCQDAPKITEAEKLKRDVLSGTLEAWDGSQSADEPVASVSRPQHTRENVLSRHADRETSSSLNEKIKGGHKKSALERSRSRDALAGCNGSKSMRADLPGCIASPAEAAVQDKVSPLSPPSDIPPSQAQPHDLRARIDRLKQEVGEDWLRVLSRGD